MIKRIILTALLTFALALGLNATVLDSLSYDVRLGYALGGTVPTHLGNEIRGINGYYPDYNFTVAAEASYPLGGKWYLHSGLRFELGSMDVDSRVKNYDIEVVRGEESLKGIFNGNVRIKSAQRRLTLPIRVSHQRQVDSPWRRVHGVVDQPAFLGMGL